MRISKFGAAGIAASLAFGGAALAWADETAPADPTLDPGTTTTAVAPSTTTTVAPSDGTEVEAPEADEADEAGDHEHPDNHGKAVSEAAHNTPAGPGHGQAVSAEAHAHHGHGADHGHGHDASGDDDITESPEGS
jgi:hypothetical protein